MLRVVPQTESCSRLHTKKMDDYLIVRLVIQHQLMHVCCCCAPYSWTVRRSSWSTGAEWPTWVCTTKTKTHQSADCRCISHRFSELLKSTRWNFLNFCRVMKSWIPQSLKKRKETCISLFTEWLPVCLCVTRVLAEKKKKKSSIEVSQYVNSPQQHWSQRGGKGAAGSGSHGGLQGPGPLLLSEGNHWPDRWKHRPLSVADVSLSGSGRVADSFLPPHFGLLDRPEVRVVDHVVLADLRGGNDAAGREHGVLFVGSGIILNEGDRKKNLA